MPFAIGLMLDAISPPPPNDCGWCLSMLELASRSSSSPFTMYELAHKIIKSTYLRRLLKLPSLACYSGFCPYLNNFRCLPLLSGRLPVLTAALSYLVVSYKYIFNVECVLTLVSELGLSRENYPAAEKAEV